MEKQQQLILEIYNTKTNANNHLSILASQVLIALDALKPKTLDGVISSEPLPAQTLLSQDFWRQLHASLKEERRILLKHEITDAKDIVSLAMMNGFADLENKDGTISAVKPAFKAGGTQLKKKKVEKESNPWGALAQTGETINEDQLMKDVEMKMEDVAGKYCGETDGIKAMKPCDNCSCGLKEIYDAEQADAAQPVIPAESNCGKCYLGDAFRCGGCPYRGQPAFEPGDKLKLQNASVGEISAKTEQVKIKENQVKVVLEL